jgi:hypothetical protein
MQDTYNTDLSPALPGQIVERGVVTGVYQCSEAIPPGRVVELHTDGKLRLPQGTGADIAKPVGVSCYRAAIEPNSGNGYAIGEYVPVLRRGQIWADLVSGATVSALAAANVYHSSTVATNRGKVGSAAEAAGAGVEIDALSGFLFLRDDGASSPALALLEVSLA